MVDTQIPFYTYSMWVRHELWGKASAEASGKPDQYLQQLGEAECYVQHQCQSGTVQVSKYIDQLQRAIDADCIAAEDYFCYLIPLTFRIEKLSEKPLINKRQLKVLDNIHVLIQLRIWWIETTGDKSRITKCPYKDTHTGAFYEFVNAELINLGKPLGGTRLGELIKEVCDSVDPLYIDIHQN